MFCIVSYLVASTIATRIGLSLGLQGLQIIYVDQINDYTSSYVTDLLPANRAGLQTPTQPRPFSLVDVNTRGHLPVVQTKRASQKTDGSGRLRSGVRYCFLGMSLVVSPARLAGSLVRIG